MSAQPLVPPPAAFRTLRVLLIEDSLDDAMLLERHLRRVGFSPSITRIETAESMQRELDPELAETTAGESQRWDIVLADYNLPHFSAPEALQLLKRTPHDIPFIMMSGAVSEEAAVAAMRSGAHDYVSKQNLARLAPAIEREIAEAASRRSKRAAERALQQSEARFHRLVEATPLALFIADMAGRVVYANAGVERLLGFSQQEVESGSLTLERVLPGPNGSGPPRLPPLEALLEISLARPGEALEVTCLDHEGFALPVLLGAAILNPEAEPGSRQLAAFLVDLREQKRSEEVLRRTEKLAAAGRLAASIAHEINNPLEAITNCMYLLEQAELPQDARNYLRLAQQELQRVTHITTQTLRFYRQSTRPAHTDLAELIETVLTLYEPRLRDHGVQIVRDFRPVPLVLAYAGEIRQVLANLVGNALEAMAALPGREQGGRLVLRLHPTHDVRSHLPSVAVLVADTGIGMAPETRRRIYEPFFSTKGITGTGLGLWVSCEIVNRHRGRLSVRTRQEVPSGTVFRLALPIEQEPEALDAKRASILVDTPFI
ncbi:MAG TPA: ATP-binding protein [Acidobacteriaceae bacterium]